VDNLPVRGSVYCVRKIIKTKMYYFAEQSLGFISVLMEGKIGWKLTGGLPQSICVRDIAIQEQENDIVIATFGRGFYIIDDYSVLQTIKKEDLEKKATIFPMMDGLVFNQSQPYGHKGKSFQGESFYVAENPPIGATIRYYVKDDYKSLKDKRKELEREKIKNNQAIAYPSKDSMRLEDNEEAPYLLLVITDEQGNEIRKIKTISY
jgi:hypothetical protein